MLFSSLFCLSITVTVFEIYENIGSGGNTVLGKFDSFCNPQDSSWKDFLAKSAENPFMRALSLIETHAYWIKNTDREFVYASDSTYRMMGLSPKESILGKKDEDLMSEAIASRYRHDDNVVLGSGVSLENIVELVSNSHGNLDWNITTKWPIFDDNRKIIGVMGLTHTINNRNVFETNSTVLMPALILMLDDLSQPIKISTLAKSTCLSVSQFGRLFKKRFGMSPHQYRNKIKLEEVCDLLTKTELSFVDIASKCGFFDQSHLSQQFRKKFRMTPSEYRKEYT